MINLFSSWAKNLSLAIIIVSILEMLLPNNKTKKYIKVIMGIYILFSIISPFIKNKDSLNLTEVVADAYKDDDYIETREVVDQSSMDKRINDIYEEELEKDITNKLEEKAYKVDSCKVELATENTNNQVNIHKIKLNLRKSTKISEIEKDSIKEFLINEYGVEEKCLKIN